MPKRIGHIKEQVCTAENVRAAWEEFMRRRPVRLRREFRQETADEILEALQACRFDTGGIRIKQIYEGGKLRILRIPSFRSAMAQTALFRIVGPIIDRRLHGRTYSSRKGFGMHKCALTQNKHVQMHPKAYKYALYCDIRKFYDHIRHEDVERTIVRIFKDPYVAEAIRAILAYGGAGMPIGFPASHTLANLVLQPVYYRVRAIKGVTDFYVYMDNFTVYGSSKAALKRARIAIVGHLAALGMEIKPDWQIFPLAKRAVHSCGFLIRHGHPLRLYRGIFKRTMRNIRAFKRRPKIGPARSLTSRIGWLQAVKKEHILFNNIRYKRLIGILQS